MPSLSACLARALVAFLFSLNNVLPPLSYLTKMDVFLFSSLALRVDRCARWVFPIVFAALHLVLWTT